MGIIPKTIYLMASLGNCHREIICKCVFNKQNEDGTLPKFIVLLASCGFQFTNIGLLLGETLYPVFSIRMSTNSMKTKRIKPKLGSKLCKVFF